jgi:hypothetical protein
LPLSASIASATSIQSAFTGYHLSPTNLAPGSAGSSHSAVVCRIAASLSLSTENLIMLVPSFARYTRNPLTIVLTSLSTLFMPY